MTEVIRVDPLNPDPAALVRAAGCLRDGGLVAFPTETVYGLGGSALDRTAVRRIFAAKGRPAEDPLIVHLADAAQLGSVVSHVPESALLLAQRFWPGPLTLVLERSRAVPDEVTARLETVAVRVPAHPVARALLEAARLPIAAPSANLFSRPSPTRAEHVLADLDGLIDMVVDAGPTTVGVESTVVDLTGDPAVVLRPGAVTLDMLASVLPQVEQRTAVPLGGKRMTSPGMMAKHYAPRAPMTLYEGEDGKMLARMAADAGTAAARGHSVGVLAADEDVINWPARIVRIGPKDNPAAIATRLYDAVRELDASGVDLILARGFTAQSGLWAAIQDRLRRAAAGQVVTCD